MTRHPPVIQVDAMARVPARVLRDPVGLVQALTIENPTASGDDRFYPLARIDDAWDEVVVPRAFDVRPWLKPRYSDIATVSDLDSIEWPHVNLGDRSPALGPNEHLRYDQGPAWASIAPPPANPWGRILALGCGKGKTVLSLKLAQLRAVPTLVICHTLNMMETWGRTAVDLFGASPHQIGFIGGGLKQWNRDLVLATMPGVLSNWPREFYSRFGLVIMDEGDLLGARHLSKILPLFVGERLLVTATVERSDGMEALYYNHVGPVVFSDIVPDMQPRCFFLDSPVPASVIVTKGKRNPKKIRTPTERQAWNGFVGRPTANMPKTVSFIEEHCPERAAWEMEVVTELLSEGRKVLFLGERVEGLRQQHRRAVAAGLSSGLALGSSHMEQSEVDAALRNSDVVWAIQQIAKRGLNQPDIDTVVLQYTCYSDANRLQQTVGRALRYIEGKDPLVVVLNDPAVPCLVNNAEKVAAWLALQGYDVEWYE